MISPHELYNPGPLYLMVAQRRKGSNHGWQKGGNHITLILPVDTIRILYLVM
jgi:hypothetical protein